MFVLPWELPITNAWHRAKAMRWLESEPNRSNDQTIGAWLQQETWGGDHEGLVESRPNEENFSSQHFLNVRT